MTKIDSSSCAADERSAAAKALLPLGPRNLFDCQRPTLSGLFRAGPPGREPRRDVESGTLGGADRDRTDDLRLAKPALSQLSYSPGQSGRVVGLGRLELPTSRLSGGRSNRAELQALPSPGSVRSSDRALRSVPEKRMTCGDGFGRTVRSCPDRTSDRENPGFKRPRPGRRGAPVPIALDLVCRAVSARPEARGPAHAP